MLIVNPKTLRAWFKKKCYQLSIKIKGLIHKKKKINLSCKENSLCGIAKNIRIKYIKQSSVMLYKNDSFTFLISCSLTRESDKHLVLIEYGIITLFYTCNALTILWPSFFSLKPTRNAVTIHFKSVFFAIYSFLRLYAKQRKVWANTLIFKTKMFAKKNVRKSGGDK